MFSYPAKIKQPMQPASDTQQQQLGFIHNLLRLGSFEHENMELAALRAHSNQFKPLDLSTKTKQRPSESQSGPATANLTANGTHKKRHRQSPVQLLHKQNHSLNLNLSSPFRLKLEQTTANKSAIISSSTSPFSASSPSSASSDISSSQSTSSGPQHSVSLKHLAAKPVLSSAKVPHSKSSSSAKSNKSHLCLVCGRSFSRSDMLTRHSRLHSGLKPYQCNKCKQVFSRSDHLSTHERTHTGEKPYKCQQCAYSACRRDMITRHMRTHSQVGFALKPTRALL